VSPKVRVLFVVDNSGSTEPYQAKLSAGFKDFGQKYLGMNSFDLAAAVITSDTYLAPTTTSSAYGGANAKCFSRLVPGMHDGLRPNVADGISNAFNADCSLTDAAKASIMAKGDRSLNPILSTRTPDGSMLDTAGLTALAAAFQLNALPGTTGNGSERGMQSLHQFLKDNEERAACMQATVTDPTCFFPHYQLANNPVPPVNIVVFITDEHDQSKTDFGLGTVIDHTEGTYASSTDTQLASSSLTLATAAKKRFDAFFKSLHESTNADANYSVFGITNITCNTAHNTCGKQSGGKRSTNEEWGIEIDTLVDAYTGNGGTNGRVSQAADTANSEAKYSKLYDINGSNYDALFDNIALKSIDSTKWVVVNTFTVSRDIHNADAVTAVVVLGNGQTYPVPSSAISVSLPRMVSIQASVLQALIPANDDLAVVKISYP